MTAFPRTYHVTVPLIRFFKWEHGNSISLHTEVDYLLNVCGHLPTDSRASDMTLVLPHDLIHSAASPAASMY